MTDEEQIVLATVSHPAGFCVCFDELSIYRLEDGQYAVTEPGESLFNTAEEAVRFFVKRRRERQIGFDFES